MDGHFSDVQRLLNDRQNNTHSLLIMRKLLQSNISGTYLEQCSCWKNQLQLIYGGTINDGLKYL